MRAVFNNNQKIENNMNLFDLVNDPLNLLLRSYPFWQVYVKGVNLTVLSCNPFIYHPINWERIPNRECIPERNHNDTHLYINARYSDVWLDISFWIRALIILSSLEGFLFKEGPVENSWMRGSLIVPLMQEIAKRVNKRWE